MRILHVSHVVTSPGGMQLAIRNMAAAQAARGHKVCIASGDFDSPSGHIVPWSEEPKVLSANVPQLRAVLRGALGALEVGETTAGLANALGSLVANQPAAQHFRPDIIVLHSPHLYGQQMAQAIPSSSRAHVVGVIHQDATTDTAEILRTLQLAHVFTVNDTSRVLLANAGIAPVTSGILGIDLNRFRVDSRVGDQTPLLAQRAGPILFHPSARLQQNKGTDIAIRALASVREVHPEASLLLCDPGRTGDRLPRDLHFAEELVELAESLGVSDYIWIGDVRGGQHLVSAEAPEPRGFATVRMPSVFRAVARSGGVVVHPSHREGFGLVIAEAMACGAPVVCSDIPGQREAAGEAAKLFTHGRDSQESARELAKGVLDVLGSSNTRNRMIKTGLEHVRKFDFDQSMGRVEATLAGLGPRAAGLELG